MDMDMDIIDVTNLLSNYYRLQISNGVKSRQAYNFVTDNFPILFERVQTRAKSIGHIAPNHVGQQYLHRTQLILAGLHTELEAGICVGVNHHENREDVQVATCVVATYPRHHLNDGDDIFCYIAEGEDIAKAHRRVLDDQDEHSRRNQAIHNCIRERTPVRLVVGGNGRNYQYVGLYRVVAMHDVVTSQGRTAFEYTLLRRHEQSSPTQF